MILRTFECLDCKAMFEVTLDSIDAADPPCPRCDIVMEWRPVSFNIGSGKTKSTDAMREQIAAEFGVTNMNDAHHEGDVAFKQDAKTKSETDALAMVKDEIKEQMGKIETTNPQMQANIKAFFGGGPQNIMAGIDVNSTLAAAKQGPGAYTKTNNPMTMLHAAGKKGLLPSNMRIVARG